MFHVEHSCKKKGFFTMKRKMCIIHNNSSNPWQITTHAAWIAGTGAFEIPPLKIGRDGGVRK